MNILTLTSDLGTRDYYLAAVKAAALKAVPDLNWVDISHHIPPFDMAKAAFVLKNVWKEFPEGTIHLVGVETDWGHDTPYVVIQHMGHYFIGTDNGFFSLLFGETKVDGVYRVNMRGDEDLSFPTKTIFIPLAARIFAGEDLESFADREEAFKTRSTFIPVVEHNALKGIAIYIDSYGNVVTNITRDQFDAFVGDRDFQIVVNRTDAVLSAISRTYSEVPQGEVVALFTSEGFLEIAINRGVEGSGGGAAGLLGIKLQDMIRVELGY